MNERQPIDAALDEAFMQTTQVDEYYGVGRFDDDGILQGDDLAWAVQQDLNAYFGSPAEELGAVPLMDAVDTDFGHGPLSWVETNVPRKSNGFGGRSKTDRDHGYAVPAVAPESPIIAASEGMQASHQANMVEVDQMTTYQWDPDLNEHVLVPASDEQKQRERDWVKTKFEKTYAAGMEEVLQQQPYAKHAGTAVTEEQRRMADRDLLLDNDRGKKRWW